MQGREQSLRLLCLTNTGAQGLEGGRDGAQQNWGGA